jgi:hypothetical protein
MQSDPRGTVETFFACGWEVSGKFELGRLLDWKVAGLRPAKNLVDIVARAPEQVRVVCSIGHETSRLEIVAERVNCRQSRAQRQGVDASVVGVYQRVGTHVKCLRPAVLSENSIRLGVRFVR